MADQDPNLPPDYSSGTQPEHPPGAQTEHKSGPQPEHLPGTQAEHKSGPQPDHSPGTQAEHKSGPQPDHSLGTQSEHKSGPQPVLASDSAVAQPVAKPVVQPVVQSVVQGVSRPGRFAQNPPPEAKDTDSYAERLIKYIPADIVAAYVAIEGVLKQGGNDPHWLNWAVFGGMLALTPLYVMYMKTDPPGFAIAKAFHAFAATLSFTVWVFAMGGPFALSFAWYKPVLGSVLLIFTTLLLPVLENFTYPSSPGSKSPPSASPPST
jgi:hypothetical protein